MVIGLRTDRNYTTSYSGTGLYQAEIRANDILIRYNGSFVVQLPGVGFISQGGQLSNNLSYRLRRVNDYIYLLDRNRNVLWAFQTPYSGTLYGIATLFQSGSAVAVEACRN